MNEIVRNRTIRPSTRNEKSKSYKIDTKQVCRGDTLVVNIGHENKSFRKTYKFNGTDVANKNSISFSVNEYGDRIDISWSGAAPVSNFLESKLESKQIIQKQSRQSIGPKKGTAIISIEELKSSFDPISNSEIEVLILGTIPGDKSISVKEYYAHPRNRFWRIISTITKSELPGDYRSKTQLLLKNKIGVWDVAHHANRKGSLDSNIVSEIPNDLDKLISKCGKLRIVGFNGAKSEALFNKYFSKKEKISYITLPSTSPANASMSFDTICKIWQQLLGK